MQQFIQLSYQDYSTLRDLMKELQENDALEDKLTVKEATILAKIETIIGNMDRRRAEDRTGTRPQVTTK